MVNHDITSALTFVSKPLRLVDELMAAELVGDSWLLYLISPARFAKSPEDAGICVSRFRKKRQRARLTHRFSDDGLCAFPPPSSLLFHSPNSPKLPRAEIS